METYLLIAASTVMLVMAISLTTYMADQAAMLRTAAYAATLTIVMVTQMTSKWWVELTGMPAEPAILAATTLLAASLALVVAAYLRSRPTPKSYAI